MTTPTIRSALYAVLVAASALAVAYGVITQDNAALWVALAVAVLDAAGLLLARRHVPDAPDAVQAAQAAADRNASPGGLT